MKNHNVASKSSVNTENSQMTSIAGILSYIYRTKHPHPWPTYCVVLDLLLAVYSSREPKHLYTSDKSQKQATKSKLENVQYQFLSELLVSVYDYSVITKVAILLSLRVKARHIFSLILFSCPHPQRAMQFIWFHKKETPTQRSYI